MSAITRQRLRNRKRRIEHRLRKIHWADQPRPMLTARNIQYEVADRARGVSAGGIGAMHLLARRMGLIEALDRRLHLLKVHLPYHESDHMLNVAYNILAGGTCLEDIEQRRSADGGCQAAAEGHSGRRRGRFTAGSSAGGSTAAARGKESHRAGGTRRAGQPAASGRLRGVLLRPWDSSVVSDARKHCFRATLGADRRGFGRNGIAFPVGRCHFGL